MHVEILIEDSSGEQLLNCLLPRILGPLGGPHTWRLHSYKGIGRIPRDLKTTGDASKRILLDQVPKILRGYAKSPGIDAIVVVLDSDRKDCKAFLAELKALADDCDMSSKTLFRLAIEETEAWYLGDREALAKAYPRAKTKALDDYVQDSVCGTWEVVADALFPGGSKKVKKAGWPLPGQLKHEWAEKIGPLMDIEDNASPSFCKLRDGLRWLAGENA